MNPQTIEEQLRVELEDLHRRCMAGRRFNRNPNEIDQHCDTADMEWSERLERERAAELRGAELAAKTQNEEKETTSRQNNNVKEAAAMAALQPATAQTIWDSVGRDVAPNRLFEQHRSEEAGRTTETIQAHINDRYDRLQIGLTQAIERIRRDIDPDLDFTLRKPDIRDPQQDLLQRARAMLSRAHEPERDRED